MSDVIRLSKKNIDDLEMLRNTFIEYYKREDAGRPDLIEYEIERWTNASYNELIDNAVFTAKWYLNHQ